VVLSGEWFKVNPTNYFFVNALIVVEGRPLNADQHTELDRDADIARPPPKIAY